MSTASAYPQHEIARFGREDGTASRSPALAIEKLRRALAHDWTDSVASPRERELYEREFAEAFVASVMALDVRIGDEVVPDDHGQVTLASTNIDAHYVLDAVVDDVALIRRASFPQWAPARTPVANLRRVSEGACSMHVGPVATDEAGLRDEFGILDDGKPVEVDGKSQVSVLNADQARVALEVRAKGVFEPDSRRPARLMQRRATGWSEIPGDGARGTEPTGDRADA